MKNLRKTIVAMTLALNLIFPNKADAFLFLIPAALAEMAAVVAVSSEVVIANAAVATGIGTAGTVVIRNVAKEGGKYTVKYGANYILRRSFGGVMKLSKSQLKQIKHSKIIWNPKYFPKRGKQLLYYISLQHKGHTYYKIGITAKSLKQRYRREYHSAKIKPIIMLEMPIKSAYALEQSITKSFYSDRAFNKGILTKDKGYTEVFKKDVLKLDGRVLSVLRKF